MQRWQQFFFCSLAIVSGGQLTAETSSFIFPRGLEPGDQIALVAPAGPLDTAGVELATRRLEEHGFKVTRRPDLLRKNDYLAGDDRTRAEELMTAFRDPAVAAIFPGRGGYGTPRILDLLDYDVIRANPKIVIGFSDITGLHLALQKKAKLVTYHSPVPMWGLGSEKGLPAISSYWFWRALLSNHDAAEAGGPGYLISATWPTAETGDYTRQCDMPPLETIHGGTGRGRLIGGNLSLVAALSGTPFEMETEGRILLLEDIGEAPYRVDRMLNTLRLAGKLHGLSGVLLGTFTRRDTEDTSDEVTTIDDVLHHYFANLGVPVVSHFPIGHHECNITLPLGALYEIDGDRQTLRLLESPVRTAASAMLPGQ